MDSLPIGSMFPLKFQSISELEGMGPQGLHRGHRDLFRDTDTSVDRLAGP